MSTAPNLHGKVVETLTIKVFADNALSVEGPTQDAVWCIAALEAAIDAIRGQYRRPTAPGATVVPGYDSAPLIRGA